MNLSAPRLAEPARGSAPFDVPFAGERFGFAAKTNLQHGHVWGRNGWAVFRSEKSHLGSGRRVR